MRLNGAALQAIRERSGLSQSDLARSTGVSQGRISELEAGTRNVRPATAKALAAGVGVPLLAIVAPDDVEAVA